MVVDIFNDTDIPEQLHWYGQRGPAEVDGGRTRRARPFPPFAGQGKRHT
ncbi:cupredoxin domain-containing protein [Saccharopolyspora pogona]|nr:hypothetical protein [Saccharopolyspora pogona]